MPTITVLKSDLYQLAGLAESYSLETLADSLALVKGELKPVRDSKPGEDLSLRIELADTNRPDLWCVEGVARQLRDHRRGWGQEYAFYTTQSAERRIKVDARLQAIRPYIGGFLVTGGMMDETGLLAFIEGQETLDRNFGRRRKAVSIGLYDGTAVRFPVEYRAVEREGPRFEPLAPSVQLKDGALWEPGRKMTPVEILEQHPAGQEYGWTLSGSELVPLLVDDNGEVLSLIPIINSAGLGRVALGTESLFVEATGMDLDQVLLTLNILAANLADRGWQITPVTAQYPYETPRGREVSAPHDMRITQPVPLELFNRMFGERLDAAGVVERLTAYGVSAQAEGQTVTATCPSYRQDYLHPVDVTEDYAVSRGYATFAPVMPGDFTVGRLSPLTTFEDHLRDLMIGFSFEEAFCNILTGEEIIRGRMAVGTGRADGAPPFHGGPAVRIQNVMNIHYSVLRDWLLPSLLETESHSEGAVYPHRIFEVGEAAVFNPIENLGSRTESRLAALLADEAASFDSAQSVVYALLGALHIAFRVVPWEQPSFIPGRAALVIAEGGSLADLSTWLGFLGELSPQVLTDWGARVPAAGIELSVDKLHPRSSL